MTRRAWMASALGVLPLVALGCGGGGPSAQQAEELTKADNAAREQMREMYAAKSKSKGKKKGRR